MDYIEKFKQLYRGDNVNRLKLFATTNIRNRKLYVLGLISILLIVTVSFGKPNGENLQVRKPVAPRGLMLEYQGDGILAKWDPSAGADFYTLFWGTEKGEFRKMCQTTETQVLLKGFESGQIYNFSVTASNSNYESGYSTECYVVYDDSPKNSLQHVATARDLMLETRHVEALAYLNAAIHLGPQNAESYRTRAILLEKLGKKEQARRDFKMAETLFNHNPMTSRN